MPDSPAPTIRTSVWSGLMRMPAIVGHIGSLGAAMAIRRGITAASATLSGKMCHVARPEEPAMTSFITPSASTELDDGPAIAELHRLLRRPEGAFLADPYPDAATREANLRRSGRRWS